MAKNISDIINLEQFYKEDIEGKLEYLNIITNLKLFNTITEDEAKMCEEFIGKELNIENITLARGLQFIATLVDINRTKNYEESEKYVNSIVAHMIRENNKTCECGCKDFNIEQEIMECGNIYNVKVCKNCGRKY